MHLTLMLLMNLSKIEVCADVIIGKDDKAGYFVELLFKHLLDPVLGPPVAGIYSNITSFENGRKLFAKGCLPNKLKEYLFTNER